MTEMIAGILAFTCVVASELAYIWGMWRGEVRPSRSSYWLWMLMHGGIAVTYFLEGGSWAVLFSLAYVIMFFIVALHSLHFGLGKWEKFDTFCLVIVMVSLAAWLLFDSALVGLICFMAGDLAAALPTFKKSWLQPLTEQPLAWGLTFLATLIDIFAVTQWDLSSWIYQIYFLLLNGTIFFLVFRPYLSEHLRAKI